MIFLEPRIVRRQMDLGGAMVHVVAGMTIYLLFIRGSPKATALALTPKMDLRLTQVHTAQSLYQQPNPIAISRN